MRSTALEGALGNVKLAPRQVTIENPVDGIVRGRAGLSEKSVTLLLRLGFITFQVHF
jgi:hypothetical protein